MNIIVQSKTMVITEALRRFVTEHAQKIGERTHKISTITVFLESIKKKKNDGHAQIAKFLVKIPGKNIVVQEKAKDLYFAINRAARVTLYKMDQVKAKHAVQGVGAKA